MIGTTPPTDHLTEVLETFPLDVCFAGRFVFGEPWGIRVPEGVAIIGTVVEGACRIMTGDREEVRPAAGEVFLLSPGAEQGLAGDAKAPWAPMDQWIDWVQPENRFLISHGGSTAPTTLIGGVLRFDEPSVHSFFWALPSVVRLSPDTAPDSRCPLTENLFRSLSDELTAQLPGGERIAKQLVEMLFIKTARSQLHAAGDRSDEDLVGQLLHPDLGPALALIHRQPGRPWTVAELARGVAMSRSAFAAAFTEVLGCPPVAYLRERRMQLAGQLLRNRSLGLKEVALRVGYDSVSAFNTAFKQRWGIAPGRFRNARSNASC